MKNHNLKIEMSKTPSLSRHCEQSEAISVFRLLRRKLLAMTINVKF